MKDKQDVSRGEISFVITLLVLIGINIVAWLIVGFSLIVKFNTLFSENIVATLMGLFLTAIVFIYVVILIAALVDSLRTEE